MGVEGGEDEEIDKWIVEDVWELKDVGRSF